MPWNSASGRAASWLLTISARLQRNSPVWWRSSRSARQCRYCETKRATFCGGVRELDAPVHLELARDGREGGAECGLVETGGIGGELDAHEEEAEFDILVLVGVEDVDVVAGARKLTMAATMPLRSGQSMSRMAIFGLGFGMIFSAINAVEPDYLIAKMG